LDIGIFTGINLRDAGINMHIGSFPNTLKKMPEKFQAFFLGAKKQ
jgi:hypothetical protein